MRYVCPQGCVTDVGMSKPHPGECPAGHGAFRYEKELRRTGSLRAVSEKRATEEAAGTRKRSRGSTLKRGKGMEASPAQRAKVKGTVCAGCGREAGDYVSIDPAHVWPQGKGGCGHPDCVLALCRGVDYSCHRLFDNGEFDLLSKVSANPEAFATEIAHPILAHGVTLVELVRRLAGNREEMVWVERAAA